MRSIKNDFFKLSYPPNTKNPFIIDCLELRTNEEFGRHIVTTRHLKSGDVVSNERPFYKSLDKSLSNAARCLNCHRGNLTSLFSCGSCSSRFCSKECQDLASEEFHKYECASCDQMTEDDGFLMMIERSLFKILTICGSLENLMKLINENPISTTVFDLDMNENSLELRKKLIVACNSLEAAPRTDEDIEFVNKFVESHEAVRMTWKTNSERDFLKDFIIRFIGILGRNSFTLHWNSQSHAPEIGCGILPFASLINHSCSPNLFRVCVDGSVVFVAKRPIKPNEQLFISYHQLFHQAPVQERQKSLYDQFKFRCSCIACLNKYPIEEDLRKCNSCLVVNSLDESSVCGSIHEAISNFKENCRFIDKNFEHYPCYELCRLLQSNSRLLHYIAN